MVLRASTFFSSICICSFFRFFPFPGFVVRMKRSLHRIIFSSGKTLDHGTSPWRTPSSFFFDFSSHLSKSIGGISVHKIDSSIRVPHPLLPRDVQPFVPSFRGSNRSCDGMSESTRPNPWVSGTLPRLLVPGENHAGAPPPRARNSPHFPAFISSTMALPMASPTFMYVSAFLL